MTTDNYIYYLYDQEYSQVNYPHKYYLKMILITNQLNELSNFHSQLKLTPETTIFTKNPTYPAKQTYSNKQIKFSLAPAFAKPLHRPVRTNSSSLLCAIRRSNYLNDKCAPRVGARHKPLAFSGSQNPLNECSN